MEYNNFEIITDTIIEKKNIGHAYLIKVSETYSRNNIIKFVKKIVGTYNISEDKKIEIFRKIDRNEYPDIEIIVPEGMQIKKEQIKNLKTEFKTAVNENQKRFYIIEFAEGLNDSSANALLKFLEEPENGIVALLVTKNINLVKNTLISRCQILNCEEIEDDYINDEETITKALEFLNLIMVKKVKSIPYFYIYYEMNVNEIIKIFTISSNVLYDIINYVYGFDLIFSNKKNEIVKLSENTKMEILIKMINILEDSINLLKANANVRLVFDKLIIEVWS